MPSYYPDAPSTFASISANPVSICTIDDGATGRAELKDIFSRCDEVRCVGSFANVDEALADKAKSNPQIVLLNVELPDSERLQLLNVELPDSERLQFFRQLVNGLAESNVVILTAITQVEWSKESLAAAACGLLFRSSGNEKLVGALCYVAPDGAASSKGLLHLLFVNSPAPKRTLSSEKPAFTDKDRAIMEVLSRCFLYKEIAHKLDLNIGNVKKRLNAIYKKLKVANRTEAIEIWRRP